MSGLFDRPPPRWFSIPAHRPFLGDLAAGLTPDLDAEALAHAVILTANRRAARALAEAFVRAAGGQAILPPQIRPLGDLEEGEPPFESGDLALDLPPAIDPLRRRFELIGVAAQVSNQLGRPLDAPAALELAEALGGLFDTLQIEEVDPLGRLEGLVGLDLAAHWEGSRQLIEAALVAWDDRLGELGLIDVNQRRVALLRRLAEQWDAHPPAGVLVAAGSTGTAPAAAALLGVVARAERGAVVLPGLDEGLAEDAWEKIEDGHPQAALKQLLDRNGTERGDVVTWPASNAPDTAGRWRRRVINEALRPPDSTADWPTVIAHLRDESQGADPIAAGLEGLSLIVARHEEEAGLAAALMLRETLETPGRTAALVTPDQGLIRRAGAHLARWGVIADSSAGEPLSASPAGRLAVLAARAAADPLSPQTLLALAKSPLVRLGLPPEVRAIGLPALERWGLRGPRPRSWQAILARLALPEARPAPPQAAETLGALHAAVERLIQPYAGGTATAAEAARALAETLERLAADETGDPGDLWAGPGGAAASTLLSALIHEGEGLPEVDPAAFAELFERLVEAQALHPAIATHPRLRILGALEARMARADRLILGGLEEGVWPRPGAADPFLAGPMREALGLPSPERRLGLSAHDFAQAASAPEVILLRSERREGAPAVPSRWLWRLSTLARGAGVALPSRPDILAWARALDAPLADPPRALQTAPRPRPTPPVEARPRRLPVTGVERWVRDPYATYAREVLKLYALSRPGEAVDVRLRGTAIHDALERFVAAHGGLDLGPEAEAGFVEIMAEALTAHGAPDSQLARERARAAQAAPWLVALARRRRPGATLFVEQQSRLTLNVNGRQFLLTAKADRLERRDRRIDVLDFKTGQAPSRKQIEAGLSPQLTLTAAIVAAGGFGRAATGAAGELVYVRIAGGRTPGEELVRVEADESLALADAALAGLVQRIERFDDPSQPYVSWAAPQFIGQFEGDYDHLARLWEWHVIGDGEAGDAP
ncbi:MAG: double-strand break repair protein AddB [Caulobacteraceae bacterium]|nr:double-strand break repair protein AddB [Caulobacteraceae bacterium]